MTTESDSQIENIESENAEILEFKPGVKILERYIVIELLGCGGMGSVYKVESIESGKNLALKFLHKQQTNDTTWRRFENEIRAANKLDHPNLIKVHESGLLPDGQPYFIMDLVHGESLSQLLKRKGRLPLEKVLKIFVQVGFALSYAHSNGVIHRDIKPSNIMIHSPDGDTTMGAIVKVVDFGIAKLTGHDEFNQQTLTKTGEIFGSPIYMSPEQCMGMAVDQRSDLYSLGCVIYEALTGAPPLVGDSALATMLKHQSEEALSLKEASLGIEFPQKIELLVAKLLAKDPRDRYQSAQLLTSHLVAFESAGDRSIDSPGSSDSAAPDRELLTHGQAKKREAKLEKILACCLGIFVFLAGMSIGYAMPIKSLRFKKSATEKPLTAPYIEVAEQAKKNLEPTERRNLLREFKCIAENPAKFSSYTTQKGIRTFLFPPVSIGVLSMPGRKNIAAKGEILSGQNFEGIIFRPNDDMRRFPRFLNRFREDDIDFLDLYFDEKHAEYVDEEIRWVDPLIPNVIKLKGIKTVSLENAKIKPESFAMLDDLPNLKGIWLSYTNISSEVLVKSRLLSRLEVLALYEMKNVSPIFAKVGKAGKMEHLLVKDCDVNIDDIRQISSCRSLRNLDLCTNKTITDECIPLMPEGVEVLHLNDCPITPRSIGMFKRFKKLQELSLSYTNWTAEDRQRLFDTYPNVSIPR